MTNPGPKSTPRPYPPPECELEEPVRRRVLLDDFTAEKIAEILTHQPNHRGLVVMRDELAGWLEGFDRYRPKGGGDRELYLEAYNGGRKIVDRIKNPVPFHVPYLSLAVNGTIQPGKVAAVFKKSLDGFWVSRFCATLLSRVGAFPRSRGQWS
jgi:hypothetical protein